VADPLAAGGPAHDPVGGAHRPVPGSGSPLRRDLRRRPRRFRSRHPPAEPAERDQPGRGPRRTRRCRGRPHHRDRRPVLGDDRGVHAGVTAIRAADAAKLHSGSGHAVLTRDLCGQLRVHRPHAGLGGCLGPRDVRAPVVDRRHRTAADRRHGRAHLLRAPHCGVDPAARSDGRHLAGPAPGHRGAIPAVARPVPGGGSGAGRADPPAHGRGRRHRAGDGERLSPVRPPGGAHRHRRGHRHRDRAAVPARAFRDRRPASGAGVAGGEGARRRRGP
jgi:hypothetical protein